MKKLILVILLFISAAVKATDYYVKISGNNANTGLSDAQAWATIAKVNSAFSNMRPGDRILFNRGDSFYGTLKITKSGLAGSPIMIGAYGSGEKPVITGFTVVSGWTNEGNGIYSKVLTSEAKTNMVIIDDIITGMGRYPDLNYLTYESFSNNASITDNGLGEVINWSGAEVVIRKNDWSLDRCLITDHTGDKLTYTNLGTSQNATDNYGYFIQNDLRCVTNYGEWYHDTGSGKLFMYFGAVDPSTKTVKVATLNNLIYNNGYDYLTIDNISFEGSIASALYFTGYYADNTIIQNCNINFSGNDGIYLEGCRNSMVNNNFINHSSRAGIYVLLGGNNNIIDNTIKNSGLIEGSSNNGTSTVGIFFIQSKVESAPQHSLIQYNNIDSSGYNGIYFTGNGIEIKNNLIKNSSLLLNDAGGIYTGGAYTGIVIDGNIIINSFGKNDGTPNKSLMAEGVYLDEYASNVRVTNNTVVNCSNSGIKLHKAHDNTIENNTSFDNYAGINFENWTGNNTVYNNKIIGNIFVAKESSQFALRSSSAINDISGFGTANNNYYARPIDDNDVFYTYQPSTGSKNRTLAEWQSFSNQDANSRKSPVAIRNINDIMIEYNATKLTRIITLEQPMIDVKGTKYVNSITLLPFTSVILMVDPNPSQPIVPVYQSSVIENASPERLEMTYDHSLANIVPAASAFKVRVNSVARNVNSLAVSGTKVILTLVSAVENGDNVTVAYTKSSANPLQTTSGGQAANISSQLVTNDCLSIPGQNDQPLTVIKNEPNSFSGFAGEIDSRGSYKQQPVNIYPNPAYDFFNILIKEPTLSPDFIRIINQSGNVVFHNKFDVEIRELQFPLNLITGCYIVQLCKGETTMYTEKLLVRN